MLNKPQGYISTAHDPWGRPMVLDLVPHRGRLYPVGRLDADSEGLVLLTNDGELTHRLTHPRYEHEKEYVVLVEGRPTEEALRRLREGVELEDGLTWPADVEAIEAPEDLGDVEERRGKERDTWLRIVIHEGRKRQIRRMCEAAGHPVRWLIRARMGPLRLRDLKAGEYHPLTKEEVEQLREEIIEKARSPSR